MENPQLPRSNISIIVAMSPDHAIGRHGSLPWHIPEDLAHFKAVTMGHAVIMGRGTFLSLPHGALPGRRNIVLSRSVSHIDGCEVCSSLPMAIDACESETEAFVIGGTSVYAQALPIASRLYVTLVHDNPRHADAFFPYIDINQWEVVAREPHDAFTFIEAVRKISA